MRQANATRVFVMISAVWTVLLFPISCDAFVGTTTRKVAPPRWPLTAALDDNDKNKNGGSNSSNNNNNDDGIPREELIEVGDFYDSSSSSSSSSSVDWDAEWKKVMQDQKLGKKIDRPGEGYYKSPAEIKAIQAANKATQQVTKVQASLPSWQMLKGDWKVRTKNCFRVCIYIAYRRSYAN